MLYQGFWRLSCPFVTFRTSRYLRLHSRVLTASRRRDELGDRHARSLYQRQVDIASTATSHYAASCVHR